MGTVRSILAHTLYYFANRKAKAMQKNLTTLLCDVKENFSIFVTLGAPWAVCK